MHKKRLNHARLEIRLRPRGPLLIKSGRETPDPTRPGMEFVRTRAAGGGERVYLPGTSLKGAIRSHAERVLHGLGVNVCDPFDKKSACRNTGTYASSDAVFSAQCPACRTFGSLKVTGRANVFDAYPEAESDADLTETRWQVGIDRQTGQTRNGALFDLEVVVGGAFATEIQLVNYQLWQLGLVAAVLRDMDEGLVPIGFGKSRGLGQVAVEVMSLSATSVGRDEGRLCGTAALSANGDREAYGLHAEDAVDLPQGMRAERTWRGTQLELREPEALEALLSAVVESPLTSFVDARSPRPSQRGRR